MINRKLREYLEQEGFDCIILETPSFDNSIIGFSTDGRLVYDLESMINEYVSDEQLDRESAIEYISYNTLRALSYMGDKSPIVINMFEGIE